MTVWENGAWNFVFVGCPNAPAENCGFANSTLPVTKVDATPHIAEKPFITYKEGSLTEFQLVVPKVQVNKIGHSTGWTVDNTTATVFDFSEVFVANERDSADTINSKISSGLHIVFQPGNYYLNKALSVTTPNQVLLGLGMAILIPINGNDVIVTGGVEGIRIAGLTLQAGTTIQPAGSSNTLL